MRFSPRRRLLWLILPVLALGGWWFHAQQEAGTYIVFTSNRSGEDECYRMYPNGYGVKRLVTQAPDAHCGGFTVSPDGKSIAYEKNGHLWVADIDGAHQRQVTHGSNDGSPVFSPDGRSLVYHSGYSSSLTRINLDGTDERQLTDATQYSVHWHDISMDGRYILFQASSLAARNPEIYRMNADGGDLRRLTVHQAPDYSPTVSPDGTYIVFQSFRGGNCDLYRMNIDGGGLRCLTPDPAGEGSFAISPDSRWIAFSSDRDAKGDLQRGDIYLMDCHGRRLRRLTHEAGEAWHPLFSPDGKRIAYQVMNTDDATDLCVINIDGRGRKMLTNNWLRSALYQRLGDGNMARFLRLHGYADDYLLSWVPAE